MSELSGGQRQKIGILRELIVSPGVMFFDEPTSSLDVESFEELKLIMSKIRKNKIIIIATHDERLAEICDIKFILN